MNSTTYVSVEELRKVRDQIDARINHFETQTTLLQYQNEVGFLTGKRCAYCQKAICEPTQEDAKRVSQTPDDQAAWAHDHCKEIHTLREALGAAEKKPASYTFPDPQERQDNAGS